MAKTNIMQKETELIYYMCLNWHLPKKQIPDSFLKPVCLIARYIYFTSNEMNQNTEKQGTVCFKEKTKHVIEWKKRTIKVLHQLHLYIWFHSAPTNQRRIITCSLYKLVIRQTVIKCKWCLRCNPPHIYFNEWSLNKLSPLFIKRMR